jgi:hypothetical protein
MLLEEGKSAYRPSDCLMSCHVYCDVNHTNPTASYQNSILKNVIKARAQYTRIKRWPAPAETQGSTFYKPVFFIAFS